MNYVDGAVLALLAIADMVFLAQLRRARARRLREERIMRCMRLVVHRANTAESFPHTPAPSAVVACRVVPNVSAA